MNGRLYIVPTPIGNLADITLRALEVLKGVAFILAEDTRNSGKLLKHFGITTKMISHHMHNEHSSVASLLAKLRAGESLALISDAGTPAISDPGFLLVRTCIQSQITVECLPGATAFVPALVNSGLPTDRFCFEGFLPEKKGRQTRFQELIEETKTMVFYVSPHKLLKTLHEFATVFGPDRQICVSRELTKIYEENKRGTIAEILDFFSSKTIKGEIVLVVAGCLKKKEKAKEIRK